MIAYKLVRKTESGKLYPLFIDRNREYIIGEKRTAEYFPTKGFAPRVGFHCCFIGFIKYKEAPIFYNESFRFGQLFYFIKTFKRTND